jgi:UDP-glucose 4-epimerase
MSRLADYNQRDYVVVTGGCGYIGSHTVLQLLTHFNVIVIDNLSNSSSVPIKRIEEMTNKVVYIVPADIRKPEEYENAFSIFNPIAVIHFAGLKAVGESVQDPLTYYDNNVIGTIKLLETMEKHGCRCMIFSSSATVYAPSTEALTEESKLGPSNPYGHSKLMIEQILRDVQKAKFWQIAILRYFNPIGAHPSGMLGEDPKGKPNNLLPYITQVLVGRRQHLSVFGNDYPTEDGTGVRDYIHVMDLAAGHIAALNKLKNSTDSCCLTYNLGTGYGHSVKQVVKTMEEVSRKKVPIKIRHRRDGDVAICYSSPHKAEMELRWQAMYGLKEMCRDAWNWQKKNPNGYK